jgi:L-threonylcarbamoyladenylate synthase
MTEVAAIVRCLKAGGVVVLPTDTVYGIAVDPNFPDAVDRLYALKQRPRRMNLPIMVASADDLEPLGLHVNEPARRLLASPLVPGGLTMAMGFAGQFRPPWLEGREEVAVRIPDDARLLAVLAAAGPLLVTSANAHGAGTPLTLAEALAQLDGAPDLAVDGGALKDVPSTLVNCRLDPPVVEREGAIAASQVLEYLA